MCRDAWVPASGAEGALVGSPGIAELSSAIEAIATRWGPGVAFQFHAGCGDESLPVHLANPLTIDRKCRLHRFVFRRLAYILMATVLYELYKYAF